MVLGSGFQMLGFVLPGLDSEVQEVDVQERGLTCSSV